MSNAQVPFIYFKPSDYVHKGPFYCSALEQMQRRYATKTERLGHRFFERMKEEARLMGFKHTRLHYYPTTFTHVNSVLVKDYQWFVAFYVNYEGWAYVYFFPHSFEHTQKDGTFSDRSIAVFALQDPGCEKPISEDDLEAITSTVGTFFDHAYTTLYGG